MKLRWDAPEQVQSMEAPPPKQQDSKTLHPTPGAKHHRTHPEVLSQRLEGSEKSLINGAAWSGLVPVLPTDAGSDWDMGNLEVILTP